MCVEKIVQSDFSVETDLKGKNYYNCRFITFIISGDSMIV